MDNEVRIMGKEIMRHIVRFACRLAVAALIFFAGVMLNGAVFNSNYGGGLPIIMLAFGAVAVIYAVVALVRFAVSVFKTIKDR